MDQFEPADDPARAVQDAADADEARGELRRKAIIGVVGVLVLALIFFGIKSFLAKPVRPHKMVQELTLLKPPPPPPPKPEEKPPEPEIKKEEVKIDPPKDEPKPDNEPPPALKPLGLDADASGGSDGFGLAANKGGRGIETTAGMSEGPGGNGTGVMIRKDPGEAYNRKIKALIQEALARDKDLQGYDYSVKVALVPRAEGGGFRVTMNDSTGNPKADAALHAALERLAGTLPAPPNSATRLIKIDSRT
jgi:protein TonB